MRNLFIAGLFLVIVTACGTKEEVKDEANPEQTETGISEEDEKELKDVQDANVELEQLDGEIDSLLNTI